MWTDRQRFVKQLIANLLLLLLAYGGFFREGFSADSISQKIWPVTNIETQVMNGRFLAWGLMQGLFELGVNPVYHYKVFYLLFLLNVGLALTVLQSTLLPLVYREESNAKEAASGLLSYAGVCVIISLVYINGLFCENFMFPEWFLTFSLAHLLCAIALYCFANNRFVPAFIFVLCAVLFYQAHLIPTAILAITILFLKKDGRIDRKLVYHSLGIVAVSVFLILGTLRIGTGVNSIVHLQSGVAGKDATLPDIGLTLRNLARAVRSFFVSGFGLLPPVCLPLFVFLLPLIVLFLHAKRAGTWRGFGHTLLLMVCFMAFSFIIVMNDNLSGITGRLLGGLYTTQAMGLLIACYQLQDGRMRRAILLSGGVYIAVQVVFCNTIMMNHYISNELDLNYAKEVYEQIKLYEAETGESIKTVVYTQDADCKGSYDEVYYKFGEINSRCIHRTGWILVSYVSQGDGRTFDRGEMDERIYETYFAGRDWNRFVPQEQLVFEEDTLYWCVY